MQWEVWVGAAKSCNQMVLEGSDGPFCSIAPMDSWGNQLEVDGFLMEEVLQGCGAFIVEFVQLGLQASFD
jgi:hypothetical protein